MKLRLAHVFRTQRQQRQLSIHDVAHLVGYTQRIRKGVRRIERFEVDGTGNREFLSLIFAAVGLTLESAEREIEAQIVRENDAWLASWLIAHSDAPVSLSFRVRCLPGVYSDTPVPVTIRTPVEAVQHVRSFAAAKALEVCLPLTPKLLVYFNRLGHVTCIQSAQAV